MTRLLTLASVPLGLALAAATILVVIGVIAFAITSYRLYDSALTTTTSRTALYEALLQEIGVIDRLALDVPRRPLERTYLTWMETKQEPARITAALAFLDEVEAAAAQRSQDVHVLDQDTDRIVRRLAAIRDRYEEDLQLWAERASGPAGATLIAIGAGHAPPEMHPGAEQR
ncbi:MAG TPA: hypothetical protein ENK18_16750 [Deltaproteobacteria bacterium]|nr:hypothetical protein [Deltaproteobacteria bacterium]